MNMRLFWSVAFDLPELSRIVHNLGVAQPLQHRFNTASNVQVRLREEASKGDHKAAMDVPRRSFGRGAMEKKSRRVEY